MAYQDTLSPAQVLNKEISATRKVFDAIGRWFAAVGTSISLAAAARARYETLKALQGMSDGQLAELNLKRDDLARHVFQDTFYS